MKHQPYAHQEKIRKKIGGQKYFALFAEMGTGKTWSAIDWYERLFESNRVDAILVVGLNGMYKNWRREIPALSSLDDWLIGTYSSFMRAADKELIKRVSKRYTRDKGRPRALLMNVEAFTSKKAVAVAKEFMEKHRTLMVIDESTAIKGHKAARSKALVNLGGLAAYRMIMTGTPTPASPMDLWMPARFLDPKALGGRNFFMFQKRYCTFEKKFFGKRSFDVVSGYQNLDELKSLMAPWSFRITKDECLDLPEKNYAWLEFGLSDKAKTEYDRMRDSLIAQIESGELVEATSVMGQMHKLQQLACGYVTDDEGNGHLIDDSRFKAVLDAVRMAGGPVIIWAPYRFALQKLRETLEGEFKLCNYWGEIPPAEREEGLQAFYDGEAQVFLGNPQSGGYGLTLVQAKTMIFFANTAHLEYRLQAEDRFHRIGQTEHVTIYDLVAEGTRDEKLVEILRNKQNFQSQLMNDPAKTFLGFLK